jgi:hypothetical protein
MQKPVSTGNEVETPKEHLTREQKRFLQRINQEASKLHTHLVDKFTEFIVTCEDPEGGEVYEKMKSLSAQWKLFCKRKNLRPEAFNVIEDYCKSTIKEYNEIRNSGYLATSENPPVSASGSTQEEAEENLKSDLAEIERIQAGE